MTTEALAAAGLNPTGVVGARVTAWKGNLSGGGNDVFVVEADEYDRSFLALAPDVAVVTNVEADHLDIYRDLDDVREAFEQFVRDARWIVLCADQSGSHHLRTPPSAEVVRYGVSSLDARLVARAIETRDGRTTFDVHFDGVRRGRVSIGAVGQHNVLNALAALGVGLARFGVTVEQMAPGLASFAGAERRFQRIGDAGGVSVVDDYAHHPTEVRATLSAARLAFPGRRIVIAFQPHLFSRTRDFAADFGLALARADELFLCDIYPAREQPIPDVSSGLIADSAALAGRRPVWMGSRSGLAAALAGFVKRGDIVLTVGAGDITKTGPELLALLGGTT
jgi:UDP-N-acetylmuramate--alanine ligase